MVVGTHPHVLQPIEAYQGSVILYSIGNFCFGGNRNPSDKDTVIAQLTVSGTGEDRSWEMSYIPCCVSSVSNRNDYRPTPTRRIRRPTAAVFRSWTAPSVPRSPSLRQRRPPSAAGTHARCRTPLPLPDGGVIGEPPAKPEEEYAKRAADAALFVLSAQV